MDKVKDTTIVIYGAHSPDWMLALAPNSHAWTRILDGGEVLHVAEDDDMSAWPAGRGDIVVIPLLEHHIRTAPEPFASLKPTRECLETFANKALWHKEMGRHGFSGLLPESFTSPLNAKFPCVLKRTDLNGGVGIVRVDSPEALMTLRQSSIFASQRILIEDFIPGAREYVTHAVCRDGRILWHHTFQYVMRDEDPIRRPTSRFKIGSTRLGPTPLKAFREIIKAFNYTGPMNIDFKMRKSDPVILEINPRLGGSLMRPENSEILAQALHHIVSAALASRPASGAS